jgi:hypothetical protein
MYKKTQIGKSIISVVGFTALITGLVGILAREYIGLAPTIILLSISGILLFCLITFSTLTVKIDRGILTVRYSFGIIKKKIELRRISSWTPIEFMGGHGWGPRKTSEGWFFNVSNSGAVKLNLEGGKTFFVGTNEPKKLALALNSRN